LQWFLPFWFPKEPIFWLPYGLFPHWAEWLLSFPRAPIGSVSIVSWQLACAGVIRLVFQTVTAIVALVRSVQTGTQAKARKVPVPVPAGQASKNQEL
jgi:tail-anchored protein insertion receptor